MRNRPRHSIPGLFALGLAVTLAACGAQSPKTEQPMSGTSMPPLQKQFKAHFALNQASLSAKDAEAVQAAAAELRANPAATIRLVGKTDTTGSASYNMHLSQRRAETVSKALIAAGVPAYRINWQALGESQLEVPTGNDVREPKNRVVDIFVGV